MIEYSYFEKLKTPSDPYPWPHFSSFLAYELKWGHGQYPGQSVGTLRLSKLHRIVDCGATGPRNCKHVMSRSILTTIVPACTPMKVPYLSGYNAFVTLVVGNQSPGLLPFVLRLGALILVNNVRSKHWTSVRASSGYQESTVQDRTWMYQSLVSAHSRCFSNSCIIRHRSDL